MSLSAIPGGAAGLGLAAALLLMIAAWVVSLLRRDVSVIDALWGPGFVLVAWVWRSALQATHTRALVVALLVTLWGLRLGAYIAARNRGRGEDPRYAQMRARSPGSFARTSLVTVFALQATLLWFLSMPVFAILRAPGATFPSGWDVAGLSLWTLGFAFEVIGDAQLARFKSDARNRGRVMNRGLWAWTRHPNYFGEACMAFGLAIVAQSVAGAAWVFVSPVLLLFLLLRVSGVSLLESHMSVRPGYREYVARTSAFLPLPPRRG